MPDGNQFVARMPDFLVIGAEKSATTWLHGSLRKHPDIFLPLIKETRYFEREYYRGKKWYGHFFEEARSHQLIGEVCPVYLCGDGVAERIHAAIPDVRIIVSLRNPVARAYSEYWMDVRGHRAQGMEPKSFESSISEEQKYLGKGHYSKYVSRYMDLFGRDRIFVIFIENLIREPVVEINMLLQWLGLKGLDKHAIDVGPKNESRAYISPRLFGILQKAVHAINDSMFAPIIWWSKRVGVRDIMLRALEKPNPYPSMQADTRLRLARYYAKPNEDLRRLLGIDRLPW